jgi:Vitamin B6 photo-protection and homoeostasis
MFLPMICFGNICKAICGVSAGACGGSINLFWATGSDISDIQAKFGAQHTVTASLGLVAAAVFAKSVATNVQSSGVLYTIYSILTVLHIYANMKCMRLIAFTSFNSVRLKLIVGPYIDHWAQNGQLLSNIPTPQDLAQSEPLFFQPFTSCLSALRTTILRQGKMSIPLLFGVAFNEFRQKSGKTPQQLQELLLSSKESSTNSDYYLVSSGIDPDKSGNYYIVVALSDNCTAENQIRAYLHATLLRHKLESTIEQHRKTNRDVTQGSHGLNSTVDAWKLDRSIVESEVANEMPIIWDAFRKSCVQAGWNIMAPSELKTIGYGITCS